MNKREMEQWKQESVAQAYNELESEVMVQHAEYQSLGAKMQTKTRWAGVVMMLAISCIVSGNITFCTDMETGQSWTIMSY